MRTKDFISILYAAALSVAILCPASGTIVIRRGSLAAAPSWYLSEDFEGTGTPTTPFAYTDVDTVDWDSTVQVGAGAQSIRIGTSTSYSYTTVADAVDYELVCQAYFTNPSANGSTRTTFGLRNSAGTFTVAAAYMTADGQLGIFSNALVASTDVVPTATWIWIKIIYNETSNICSIEWLVDSTRDGVVPTFTGVPGTKYAETTCRTAYAIGRLYFGAENAAVPYYFDNVILDTGTIPPGSTP